MTDDAAAAVLVITAAAGVSDAVADTASRALAAVPIRLAPTAVEFLLDEGKLPAGFAPLGCDVNVVPAEGRRKRMLIADMDSTIIGVECIDGLADFAGVKTEVAAITEAAMRGEIDFEGALIARVALLKGLPEEDLERCYAERVLLNPGARTLVRTMGEAGALTALVSGGFSFFTERVARAAGFERQQANTLLVENGRLTGEVARPILGREAKFTALQRLATEAGITSAEAIAVGDGANDLEMVRAAGLGVAYHAKPALAAAANVRLEHSDLTALLALQGISAAEWRD